MALPSSAREIAFGIEIDFDRNVPDPGRVFRTMSGLIDSFQKLDHSLVSSIDSSINPVFMLEDTQAGSLKAWLHTMLVSLDDRALRSGDWKQVVGHYLVRAKYIILTFVDEHKAISDRGDLSRLQTQLVEAAEKTEVRKMPLYSPVPLPRLLGDIYSVNEAASQLSQSDEAKFLSSDGNANINVGLQFSLESMENLITKETLTNEAVVILRVKKPDYLGESKWELVLDKTIEAKVLDVAWLARFQQREVDVRPGDAIRAMLRTEVKYGYEGEVVGIRYTISKVIGVITFNPSAPRPLIPE